MMMTSQTDHRDEPVTRLLFRNTMRITPGHDVPFRQAIAEAVAFAEQHAPQLMVDVFIDEEGGTATSFQVYADSDAVLRHWELSDPYIAEVMRHCTVARFEVFGTPSESVRAGFDRMPDLEVESHPRVTGFLRRGDDQHSLGPDPEVSAGEFTEVTLEVGGSPLTARARGGDGVPVVVVHGGLADADDWVDVGAAVAPGRPVLIPNRRGRASSASLEAGYGVESEVVDLLGWLDTQEGPVDLVGHSYGGLIAVEAVRQGADVGSLVLYDPVTRPFGRAFLSRVEAALDRGDLGAVVEIINVDVSGYSRQHVRELRSGPAWPKLEQLARSLGAELAAIDRFAFVAPQRWEVPTTLIAGELSRHRPPYGPGIDVFRDALAIDDDSIVILEDQDHLAHVTAPLALARAIDVALGVGIRP